MPNICKASSYLFFIFISMRSINWSLGYLVREIPPTFMIFLVSELLSYWIYNGSRTDIVSLKPLVASLLPTVMKTFVFFSLIALHLWYSNTFLLLDTPSTFIIGKTFPPDVTSLGYSSVSILQLPGFYSWALIPLTYMFCLSYTMHIHRFIFM